MWRSTRGVLLLTLSLIAVTVALPPAASAQFDGPEKYGGDFFSRPRLTGDWGGLRDEMARRGIYVDVDFLQILQGVMTGGTKNDVSYWGEADYRLTVDTQKLGLWPGGFLQINALSTYGNSATKPAGALFPVTTSALFAAPDDPGTALIGLQFTQFLAKWVGIYAGKLYTLGGDANDFAHDWHTDFMYPGLNFNLTFGLTPLSGVGGGFVFLPFEGAVVTAGVIDPDGTPNDDFGKPFSEGVMVSAEGRVTIKPFGLVGHQLLGFTWSNKDRFSLNQDPGNIAKLLLFGTFPRLANPGPLLERIFERFFPGLAVSPVPANREGSNWTVYYNFDQYLWQPKGDPTKGVGLFFRFGISDGDPNPVKYFYSAGIGGKGVVPTRPNDTFGFGWARSQFSDSFLPFLRDRLDLGLNHEDAYEFYYNVAVAPWLGLTVNLQVIDQALDKRLSGSGPGTTLKDVDTAVIGGLRMYVRF